MVSAPTLRPNLNGATDRPFVVDVSTTNNLTNDMSSLTVDTSRNVATTSSAVAGESADNGDHSSNRVVKFSTPSPSPSPKIRQPPPFHAPPSSNVVGNGSASGNYAQSTSKATVVAFSEPTTLRAVIASTHSTNVQPVVMTNNVDSRNNFGTFLRF